MAKLNPQEQTFKQLISQDKEYLIPKYQRNYSWTKENWNDLWDDIIELEESSDKSHYMGPIVLKEIDNSKEIEIIDGQQRFCTLTLIVLSAISLMEEWINADINAEINKDYIKELKEFYIGKEGRLTPKRKLFLNKYDDPFFSTKLIASNDASSNETNMLPSHVLLKDCLKFFKKQLDNKFSNKDSESLVDFIHNSIMGNLSFIVIYVTSNDNAYTIFETLNARGLELSNTDLLKNYLFSLVQDDEADLKYIENRWDEIINIVTFKYLPNFLRYYWISHNKHITDAKLFKEIKNNSNLKSSEQIKNFFNELEVTAKIYDALDDIDHVFWKDYPGCSEYLDELKILENKAYKILAIAVYKHMQTDICKLLHVCSVIAFRYFISGKNPNEVEKTYSDIAIKISNNQITRFSKVKELLKDLYISDEIFEHNFANSVIKSKNNKAKLKHMLIKMESSKEYKEIANSSKLSLEHILPEKASSEYWSNKFEGCLNDYVYRLGNYSLLTNTDNRKCASKDFEFKKKIYANSYYKLSVELTSLIEWNPEVLKQRQLDMAKLAKELWCIDFDN